MKALILFYSYGGNTRKIAEMMQKEIGADLEEIKTVTPYTGTYNEVVDQGQREVDSGYMPKIQPIRANLSDYDTILLGSPVWWYTFAPAMKTFLHDYDLNGKIVYPFATNGGWIGHTFPDFKAVCPEANVKKGLDIQFDEHTLRTRKTEILDWIHKI